MAEDNSKRQQNDPPAANSEVDKALDDSFPASDPPSYSIPHQEDLAADDDKPAEDELGNPDRINADKRKARAKAKI